MSGTGRHAHVCCKHKGMSQITGKSIRDDSDANPEEPLLDGFPPWRPFLVRRRNH